MRVTGTVFDNPQVWSWAGGYRQWGPSTSEDSHLHRWRKTMVTVTQIWLHWVILIFGT